MLTLFPVAPFKRELLEISRKAALKFSTGLLDAFLYHHTHFPRTFENSRNTHMTHLRGQISV